MNPHTLPEGFSWRMTPQSSKEYAQLIYRDTETAVIWKMSRVWIAVISEDFRCADFRARAVPDQLSAQMWLASWVQKEASFIKAVCLRRRLETRRQEWLALGHTTLRRAS